MGNILSRLDIRNSFQERRLSEVIGPVQYCGDTWPEVRFGNLAATFQKSRFSGVDLLDLRSHHVLYTSDVKPNATTGKITNRSLRLLRRSLSKLREGGALRGIGDRAIRKCAPYPRRRAKGAGRRARGAHRWARTAWAQANGKGREAPVSICASISFLFPVRTRLRHSQKNRIQLVSPPIGSRFSRDRCFLASTLIRSYPHPSPPHRERSAVVSCSPLSCT